MLYLIPKLKWPGLPKQVFKKAPRLGVALGHMLALYHWFHLGQWTVAGSQDFLQAWVHFIVMLVGHDVVNCSANIQIWPQSPPLAQHILIGVCSLTPSWLLPAWVLMGERTASWLAYWFWVEGEHAVAVAPEFVE